MIDSGDELFVESSRNRVPPLQRSGTRLGDAQSGRVRMLVSYSTLGRCLQAGAMNAFADTSQTSFVWYTAPTFYPCLGKLLHCMYLSLHLHGSENRCSIYAFSLVVVARI